MIRTKFLFCNHPLHEPIDKQINGWLTKNHDIELIDIKFQSNISAVADSGLSAEYWHTSALIIYKEPEKSSQEQNLEKNKDD